MFVKLSPITYSALCGLTRDAMLVESDAQFLLARADQELTKARALTNGDAGFAVELTPPVYMALCGLVADSLEIETDATFILKRASAELANATAGGMIPSELLENPGHVQALRRAGFMAG